jgi:hypothetical protein
MKKPFAVIDKSLLEQLCSKNNPHDESLRRISEQYELVFPWILFAEVALNVGNPGNGGKEKTIFKMWEVLRRNRTTAADEVYEAAYRELVLRQTGRSIFEMSSERLDRLLEFEMNNPDLSQFGHFNRDMHNLAFDEREQAYQEHGSLLFPNERDFVAESLNGFVKRILPDAVLRERFLSGVLGKLLEQRYPLCKYKIRAALSNYNVTTYTKFPLTYTLLNLRRIYWRGPVVLVGESKESGKPFLRKDRNSFSDEEYVVTAVQFDRLLTMDKEMARIGNLLSEVGLWTGKCVLFQKPRFIPIADQIEKLD